MAQNLRDKRESELLLPPGTSLYQLLSLISSLHLHFQSLPPRRQERNQCLPRPLRSAGTHHSCTPNEMLFSNLFHILAAPTPELRSTEASLFNLGQLSQGCCSTLNLRFLRYDYYYTSSFLRTQTATSLFPVHLTHIPNASLRFSFPLTNNSLTLKDLIHSTEERRQEGALRGVNHEKSLH